MVWSNRNIIVVFRAFVSGIGIIKESVLSKHCPVSPSCFFSVCNTFRANRVWSVCSRQSVGRPLLAFSLFSPSFFYAGQRRAGRKEPGRGEPPAGRLPCSGKPRPQGRELLGEPRVSVALSQKRANKADLPLLTARNSGCRREAGRLTSKAHSWAIEPGSAPVPRSFPWVGGPPPTQVCVLETWSRASSKRGQEVWSTACAPSEPRAQAAAEGPGLLRTMATAPLWQLSPPNRKAIRRTGALLPLAHVGERRGPQSSPVTAPA